MSSLASGDHWNTPITPGRGELAILDHTGDTKILWNPDNEDETKVAETSFKTLRKKGYSAFMVKKDGEKGELIHDFDPDAGRIIMAPALVGG